MALQSINIELKPSSNWLKDNNLNNETYAGYYLNVSYNHKLSGNSIVYAKERVEIENTNQFRFFTAKSEDIINQEIKIELKAPNGETLFSNVGSVNSFYPAPKQKGKKDESKPYTIDIDPVDKTQLSTIFNKPKNLNLKGRIIDISQSVKVSNLQVIVWATESKEDNISFDTNTFKAIFVGKTDKDGYFFGSYPVKSYQKAFATISNSLENTVEVNISQESIIQSPIIIALDFSSLNIDTSEDCSCEISTPTLPDRNALVESNAFSQDLGGHCVNFTTPNRTLEEFIFCYAVRTTEPEIKGLTLNDKEVKLIRKKLIKTHQNFVDKVQKLNHSVLTIEMKSDEEIAQIVQMKSGLETDKSNELQSQKVMRSDIKTSVLVSEANIYQDRKYQFSNVRQVVARPNMINNQLTSLKSQLANALKDVKKTQSTIDEFEDSIGNSISISEIYKYRELYQELKKSIITFQNLLESYNDLYSSFNHLLLISDVYFVNNYGNLKASFQDYLNEIELRISEIEKTYITNHPGRKNVTVENPIDWDDEPTIYQNTTIAHGHLLCFKQQWKAAGYSLGDLLYSLPLAPCQKKQIAIFDWDRSETGSRSEIQTNEERLTAQLIRNRAVEEMMTSNLSERSQGSSSSSGKTSGWSASASVSLPAGPALVGVSGGYSSGKTSTNSSANQSSSRNLSANAMNNLMDSVQQSASSVRSQRSTVIQTVGQGETFNVTTEVITNHNHCHSLTVQYFEVLRHFVIEQNLVEVSECLFVPLEMSMFTINKILRWKNNLRTFLLDRSLLPAFDSMERIKNEYQNSDLKSVNGTYAEETIEVFSGDLRISFEFERPYISAIEESETAIQYEQRYLTTYKNWFGWISPRLSTRIITRFIPITESQKNTIFENEFASDLAREFIDNISFTAVKNNGDRIPLNLDITLVSRYKKGVPLYITLNSSIQTPKNIRRKDIKRIILESQTEVEGMSKILLKSCTLNYESLHLSESIFNAQNISNDIINKDAALFYTPLTSREKINPKNEDYNISNKLISHLNEYLEYYHRQLWQYMDNARLFNLLDGFIAPNSQGRSVSSVVENNIVGVVGNNLVMKVSSGYNLDPTFRKPSDEDIEGSLSEILFEHYKPITPPDPFRISVPTKGVYAEAVMGACNSCEHIDESRHWRFTEVPCGDEPTAINPINTDSRRVDPGNLQSKSMESPVINIQNAPTAPDPTGLGAALQLMGKSDIFKDITGLDQTQKNALAQMVQNSKNLNHSQDLASHALDVAAEMDKRKNAQQTSEKMRKDIKEDFKDDPEAKKAYLKKHYDNMLGIAPKEDDKTLIDNETLKSKIETADEVDYSSPNESLRISKNAKQSIKTTKNDLKEYFKNADVQEFNIDNFDITSYDYSDVNSYIDILFPVRTVDLTHVIIEVMGGDNNLNSALIDDLREVEGRTSNSGFSFFGLIDIAEIGMFVISFNQEEGLTIIEKWITSDSGLPNSADPETLKIFLTRAFLTFKPANHIALGMWSHGAGMLTSSGKGVVITDYSSESNLDIIDFEDVLKSSFSNSGLNKIDIIFTDSCLNGNLELMYQLKKYTEVYIGSQLNIPFDGYDYRGLFNNMSNILPDNYSDWAKLFVISYQNYYRRQDVTLSAFELNKLDLFISELKKFINLVINDSEDLNDFRKSTRKVKNISSDDGRDFMSILINLLMRSENVALESIIMDLENKFEEMRISFTARNKSKYSGMTLWIPLNKRSLNYNLSNYQLLEFDKEVKWSDFLHKINE